MTEFPPPAAYRGAFRTDEDARGVYAEAAGIGRMLPRAVARPADVESVQGLVRWAAAAGVSITPRGSGSSMAGGALGDGLILDLGDLDRIGEVDRTALRVEVAAGAICKDVERDAAKAGLRFTVDPSSAAFCTIGGMIGTNAAGARSLRWGAMRHSVNALDCVFADGSRAILRRGSDWRHVPALRRLAQQAIPRIRELAAAGPFAKPGLRKESSGYALDPFVSDDEVVDLIVGSEGTLCIVVGAELALQDRPGATATVLGAFATLEDAVSAATRAREGGAVACELLDRTFLDIARAGGHAAAVPAETEAVLLTEVEGTDPAAAVANAGGMNTLFRSLGALAVVSAMEPVAEAELWEIRHAASPTIARMHPHLRSMQFIEDGAVPPQEFARYVRGVRGALAREGLTGVIFGHAGDAHAHVNPLVDTDDREWRGRVERLLATVTALVAASGGTLAAEHGDGRLRAPLLEQVWPERALAAFRVVKQAFDPTGLLNPGVKLPRPSQSALEAIKYDPALPPLPERSRAVLRHVERHRAYARSRLDLLAELA